MLIFCTHSYPHMPAQPAQWQDWEAATSLIIPSLQHTFAGGRSYRPRELEQRAQHETHWCSHSLCYYYLIFPPT